jgi:hypothetical protein
MENTPQTENTSTKPKNVTCYIKYDYKSDNTDEVNQIFTSLQELKTKYHLKFSNHPDCGITMLIFCRDNFSEFREKLNFSVSKYTSVTKYSCDQETADKLKLQKDSFLRLHYENGLLLFSSRTPLNVHKKLVKRVFKDSEVEFDKANLVLGQENNSTDKQSPNSSKQGEFTVVNRQRKQFKGQGQGQSQGQSQSQGQGFNSNTHTRTEQSSRGGQSTRGAPLTRGTSATRGAPAVRGASTSRNWSNVVSSDAVSSA